MKRTFALISILLLISQSVFSQDGPKIQFDSEVIDYGTVVKGRDDGIRHFEFENIGNAPLVINSVKTSCGCAITSKPDSPIKPGEKGVIKVQYNMNPGPISKTITVSSNAINKSSGVVPLRIKGKVVDLGP